jgi:hypothetical protein
MCGAGPIDDSCFNVGATGSSWRPQQARLNENGKWRWNPLSLLEGVFLVLRPCRGADDHVLERSLAAAKAER